MRLMIFVLFTTSSLAQPTLTEILRSHRELVERQSEINREIVELSNKVTELTLKVEAHEQRSDTPKITDWFQAIGNISAVLVALVVAIGGAWWQLRLQKQAADSQKQLHHEQLKHDLFEKRYRVWRNLAAYLEPLRRGASIDSDKAAEMYKATREVQFLFPDICKVFIDEVYDRTIEAQTALSGSAAELYPGLDYIEWLTTNAFREAHHLFSPELQLSKDR